MRKFIVVYCDGLDYQATLVETPVGGGPFGLTSEALGLGCENVISTVFEVNPTASVIQVDLCQEGGYLVINHMDEMPLAKDLDINSVYIECRKVMSDDD